MDTEAVSCKASLFLTQHTSPQQTLDQHHQICVRPDSEDNTALPGHGWNHQPALANSK